MVKNLGVKLDNTLSLKAQISVVVGECFALHLKVTKFLSLLPLEARRVVIHAVITLCLDYAYVLFLGAAEAQVKHLQVVQNEAARLLLCLPRRS